MTKYLRASLLFILIFSTTSLAQPDNKTIAKVGGKTIGTQEFKLRFELMPHYSRKQFNEDSSKIDLLNSIITEKVLSEQAEKENLDTTEYYKLSIQQIENLYVRDAMYKADIDNKVNITPKDLQSALNRRAKTLLVRMISSADSGTVFKYYSDLKHGAAFDSIGRISDPIEFDSSKEPIKITFGQMQDDHVEDVLYGLKIGKFSAPVKSGRLWFIFKLVDVKAEIPHNVNDPNYNRTIENVLRMRKARAIGIKYLENFYKGKEATVDSTIFIQLSQKISNVLKEKESRKDYGRDNKLFLDENNILKILNDFGTAQADKNIVQIENNPIKLNEYLYSLVIYPLLIKDPSIKSVAYNLMDNLNKYIQYKFLSDAARKRGFQNLPDVKTELNIWKDDFLAKMLRNTIRDSIKVSDEDVENYFNSNKGLEKVNIQEILNNNLDVIADIFKQLRAGKDFGELAKKYTERAWTKNRNGEFGYFPITEYGEIGMAASKMRINEVYGPIRTDSGYSVIKLIGRKIDSVKVGTDFNSEKNRLKEELMMKEFNNKFFKYIAKLVEESKLSINESVLKKLNVVNIPMFTYKYIGFGGRIAALPFLDAWYDWTKYIDKKSKVLP